MYNSTTLHHDNIISTITPTTSTKTTIMIPSNGNNIYVESTIPTLVKVREKTRNGLLDTTEVDHYCTINYDGSSGGMEFDRLISLILELHKK